MDFSAFHARAAKSNWEWCAETRGVAGPTNLRRNCLAFLRAHAADESDLESAEMIVAELIANVVQHAHGLAFFHVDWNEECAVFNVFDAGAGFAPAAHSTLGDLDAESGRGLAIVRSLSLSAAIGNRVEGGGFVRVVLPVRREHASRTSEV